MSAPIAVAPDSGTSYRPPGALDPATALAPYTGPWNVRHAAHLYRRAGFGGSPDDVARAASAGMRAAVDGFIRFADASALPAQPDLGVDLHSPAEMQLAQARRVDAPGAPATMPGAPATAPADDATLEQLRKAIGMTRRDNAIAMQLWFLNRMIASPAPLQEKMTLFWHGHFTSSYQKGIPAFALVNQNNLFRANALGNIRDLTLAVSQDPAMLRYLDNAQNVKAHPNENYARELMELFTLGIGNYTETDVRESARAFTGWSIRPADYTFIDRPAVHDDGVKTFLGRSGAFSGTDIVAIIFQQPAAARWFSAKLLSFFVYSDPEPALIDAVAALLRRNDFNLAPVMSTILRSNVFYGDRAYRALVKSPVDFVVGSYQLYGIKEADMVALGALRRMGQVLFYPPDVKGWDGGAAWLNSQTLLTRENFASSLMAKTTAAWLGRAVQTYDPQTVAQAIAQAVLQGDVSASSTSRLVSYLAGAGTSALPGLSGENVDERVRGAAYLTMAMPAYQLA
jgi:uncharacterized protein (DUF1800 family)